MRDTLHILTLGDALLIGGLLICALMSLFFFPSLRPPGAQAIIEAEGDLHQRFDLSTDQIIPVFGPLGETVVEINDGRVRVKESPCPHKICVQMGFRDKKGDVIACIPNRVIVRIVGDERGKEVDGLTR